MIRRHPTQYLTLLVPILGTVFAVTNCWLTVRWLGQSSDPEWTTINRENVVIIVRARSVTTASLLHSGDQLVSVNDETITHNFSVFRNFENTRPGTHYKVGILRDGRPYDLELVTQRFSPMFWAGAIIATAIVPLEYLVCSFLLVLFSDNNRRALLLAAALALTIPEVPLFSLNQAPTWAQLIMIVGRPLSYLSFPFYLHFSTIFPDPSPILKRLSSLARKVIIYLPFIVFAFVPSIVIQYLTAYDPETAFVVREGIVGYVARYAVIIAYVGAILITLLTKRKRGSGETRRKIDIVIKGFFFSFSLLLARFFFLFFLRYSSLDMQASISSWVLESLVILGFGGLLLFPLYLIYAVYRRSLIPFNVMRRRAQEYTLIYTIVVLGYLFLIALVSYLVARALVNSLGLSVTVGIVCLLVLVARRILILVHRRIVNPEIYRLLKVSPHEMNRWLRDLFREIKAIGTAMRLRFSIDVARSHYVRQIRRDIRSAVDLDGISTVVASAISQILDSKTSFVFLEDESRDFVCPALCHSTKDTDDSQGITQGLVVPPTSFIATRLRSFRQPIRNPALEVRASVPRHEVMISPSTSEAELWDFIGSHWVVPIFSKDRLVGIVSLGDRIDGTDYSKGELRLLKDVSDVVGRAIEVQRLKNMVGSTDLAATLKQVIKAAVHTIAPAQKGSIYLWNERQKLLIIMAQYGYDDDIVSAIQLSSGEGLAGWVFEHNQLVVVPDMRSETRVKDVGNKEIKTIKSALYIPLQAWGQTIGVVCLDNTTENDAFSEDHKDEILDFAATASIAVQSSRVQSELQKFGFEINKETHGMSEILKLAYDAIANVTEVRCCSLLVLLDPYDPELSLTQKPLLTIEVSDGELSVKKTTPRRRGMSYQALRTGKPVVVSRASQYPGLNDWAADRGVKASVCFPLQITNFISALLFFHYRSEHRFSEAEMNALGVLGSQAALAMRNSLRDEELLYTDRVVWLALLTSSSHHEINQHTEIIDQAVRTVAKHVTDDRLGEEDRIKMQQMLYKAGDRAEKISQMYERSLHLYSSIQRNCIDLNQYLTSVISEWREAHPQICFEVSLCSEECPVIVISNQFDLVLKNLFTNAIRAMDNAEIKVLRVSSRRIGHRVEVTMVNSGAPIPIALQEVVFKDIVEHQGNGGGTGIGLLLGQRIIRRHEGDIWLIKSDQESTVFTLWLPIADMKDGMLE